LRAGAGALGDVVLFFTGGFFPVVFFAAGFIVVTGFVEVVFVFVAGFFLATAFFFDGTADLLSFTRISGEERQPYCVGPDPSDRGSRRERDRR
jgi:hypothetical protein